MNYIAEINAFYDWLETNQLSSNAINLWHALMATANKASWINRFAVAISVLECKTGLKTRTIERARNELQQKGRISWKKRNGNQSAEYSIISLCDKKNIRFDAQRVAQVDVQVDVQPVDINKLNYTKLNTISIGGEEYFLSDNLVSIYNQIMDNENYLHAIYKNSPIKDVSLLKEKYLPEFLATLEMRRDTEKGLNDIISHFANWLLDIKSKQDGQKQKGGKHGSREHKKSENDRWDELANSVAEAVANCN